MNMELEKDNPSAIMKALLKFGDTTFRARDCKADKMLANFDVDYCSFPPGNLEWIKKDQLFLNKDEPPVTLL